MEIFENAGFSFTCRRTKTEVFESDDVIYHILHVLASHILFKGCYHTSIDLGFFAWTSENYSNTLHVDAYFFENRNGEKISVSTTIGGYE